MGYRRRSKSVGGIDDPIGAPCTRANGSREFRGEILLNFDDDASGE